MEKLEKLLTEIGLTEKESRVYLASLALGSAPVMNIAAKAGVNRTTAYSVLESLQSMGLMSVETRGFKKLHAPENPERLELILENRKKSLHKLLPDLAALYNLKGKESVISYRQGEEGVKTVYCDLLDNVAFQDHYFVIGNTDLLLEIDRKFFEQFFEKRAKLYKDIRLFLRETPLVQKYQSLESKYNFKIKTLPRHLSLKAVMVITSQQVVITQLEAPYETLVIQNRSVVDLLSEVFDNFWSAWPENH